MDPNTDQKWTDSDLDPWVKSVIGYFLYPTVSSIPYRYVQTFISKALYFKKK